MPRVTVRSRRSPAARKAAIRAPATAPGKQPFEAFLLELSSAFVRVPSDEVDAQLAVWLRKVAEFIRVERCSFWEVPDGGLGSCRHSYAAPRFELPPALLNHHSFKWLNAQYRRGRVVAWPRIPEDIPAQATEERRFAQDSAARSALGIPVRTGSGVFVLAFVAVGHYCAWPSALIQRLTLVAEIFTNAVLRQRAEGAVRASEARNQAIIRALPDTMFVLGPQDIDPDERSFASEPSSPADLISGRPLNEIYPAAIANVIRTACQQAARSRDVVQVEYELPCARGVAQYEARLVQRDDGAVVGVVRDVTERKRVESLLRESEARFRGAFEHSAIGNAIVSLEGKWLRANSALCRILGRTETELRETTFQAVSHPDDLRPGLEFMRRALAGEIDHFELEKRYLHRDGHPITTQLTVSLVRDAARTPLYFVAQVQDLTRRKRDQAEIDRLRLELVRFGRIAVMGQLTASLAHELTQPLTAILANAEAGHRLAASGQCTLQDMLPYLEDVVECSNRAADVLGRVNNLLRKERSARIVLDLNRVALDVARVMHGDLVARGVHLETRLDPKGPEVRGDPIELQQVVLNLLLNGAEALNDVAPERREIVLATRLLEGEAELTVSDCGPGVDPAQLPRIFEPFFTTKPHGMGMGLAICADIAHSHAGRLTAENKPGGGVTMRLTLPAISAASATAAAATQTDERVGRLAR